MSLNVIKLGGSNFKSATDYRRAAGIIEKYRKPLVVVVSAFFGVTDRLYAVCKNLLDSNDDAGALIEETCLMHLDLAAEILSQGEFLDAARSEVLLLECELKKLQLGVNYIDDIPEFIVDRILASGEKFNACLLKYVLLDAGIETDVLLPEDIGIYTDGVRGNAGFDFRLSENHIRNLILDEKVYIIPGFYGISQSGKITIFGRGGSDYSAACLANCLNASSLDIWKDVNGFMSADPKVVEDSERIQRLTYDEASELAYFGARILHPRTMEPLRNKHIPIRIFNIENQEPDDFPLTIINTDRSDCVDIIKSVTYSDDFAILKVRGPAVGIVPGVISRITLLFEDMRINIKSIITSQISINFLLAEEDLDLALQCVKDAEIAVIRDIIPIRDISTIAVVGDGMIDQPGLAGRLFSVLAEMKINVLLIASGASYVSTYFIVNIKDRDIAIKSVHNEFFTKEVYYE